jgi:hypothetical protein
MKFYTGIVLGLFLIKASPCYLQTTGETRSIKAESQPFSILVNGVQFDWDNAPGSITGYSIRKRNPGDLNYGNIIANLSEQTTTWTDVTLTSGSTSEYVIFASGSNQNPATHISATHHYQPEFKSGVIVVIDTLTISENDPVILRYFNDLRRSGWHVLSLGVDQGDQPQVVKSGIINSVSTNPDITHLVLVGRVPVPYSGDIFPDGHTDHRGAWPSDGFYADLTGNWTDQTISSTSGSQTRHHNVPGDGKFDQSTFPAELKLAFGRIDFSNMDGFGTPYDLLVRYFNKNHAWRIGSIQVNTQGIIDDHFTGMQEGFSAVAWRGFPVMFGRQNTLVSDFFTAGNQPNGALWGYGCGAGSYTSCSGVGTSSQFITDSLAIPFNILFGSYFGDWDSPSNNFLRAPLASKGLGLVTMWGGRPYLYLHPMTAGATVGEMFRRSVNNPPFNYGNAVGIKGVHMALMGDPTLVMYNLSDSLHTTVQVQCDSIRIDWSALGNIDPDFVEVLASYGRDQAFQRMSLLPYPMGGSFSFSASIPGDIDILVRPMYLQTTGSGTTYFSGVGNLFQSTLSFPVASLTQVQNPSISDCTGSVGLVASGVAPLSLTWTHIESGTSGSDTLGLCAGTYVWQVSDANFCQSKPDTLILAPPSGFDVLLANPMVIYPNPALTFIHSGSFEANNDYFIFDLSGRIISSGTFSVEQPGIDISWILPGMYFIYSAGKTGKFLILSAE